MACELVVDRAARARELDYSETVELPRLAAWTWQQIENNNQDIQVAEVWRDYFQAAGDKERANDCAQAADHARYENKFLLADLDRARRNLADRKAYLKEDYLMARVCRCP